MDIYLFLALVGLNLLGYALGCVLKNTAIKLICASLFIALGAWLLISQLEYITGVGVVFS